MPAARRRKLSNATEISLKQRHHTVMRLLPSCNTALPNARLRRLKLYRLTLFQRQTEQGRNGWSDALLRGRDIRHG
jgi:hypothetical protein